MLVPKLDTILVRNNNIQNSRQMRIPTDLNKPVLVHFDENKSVNSTNSKLDYFA